MDQNPYLAPTSPLETVNANSDSVKIRNEHLKHEASLKGVGALYYLGGFFMIIASPSMFISSGLESGRDFDKLFLFLGVLYLLLGIASLFVGRGLRTLRNWVKLPVGILSGLGLLGIPVGTIINAYILYLVFSQKGKMVLSDEYKLIIKQTPEIKYKTSRVVIALLVILLILIVLAVIGTVAGL